MEPTYMPTEHSDADAVMSCRVCGQHHAAANEHMPRSIWQPGVVRRLADYIKHVREVDNQSDKSDKSGEPNKSCVTRHVCTRDSTRTCLCPRGACADDSSTYRNARGPYLYAEPAKSAKPTESTVYTCPISGRICLQFNCRDWCESGVDRTKT